MKKLLRPVRDPTTAFAFFDRSVREWRVPLDLETWMIELRWDDSEDAWASCEAEPEYKKALLKMNAATFAREGFTPLQIESVAVHELVHAIIWPGYNQLANPQIPVEVRSYFEEVAADQLAHGLMMAKYRHAPEVRTMWHGYKTTGPMPSRSRTAGN